MKTRLLFAISLLAMLSVGVETRAEPYLAVHTGAHCSACHVNATGGGLRTRFGLIYSQTELAAEQ